ncbi:MAG: hypothetical protein BIP78_1551 [Candidatus Bipolaricaulis sibiricus]|uniref:Uncharacterized protein n=1 Tax=Bipolaricaulis sibiricus TaxID=2501609 RepID=A0A410FW56_BIPS1|nr:MAG: hypothetical protein BIP78_1551 [Candidatus Bipolaricaulis sibiricus]
MVIGFDIPARPSVLYGVGVSIRVEFGASGGWVRFIGAGGDSLLWDACSCKRRG